MAKKTKRPQTPKSRNREYAAGMQELRRSNAAGAHKTEKDYRRKGKYGNNWS